MFYLRGVYGGATYTTNPIRGHAIPYATKILFASSSVETLKRKKM